MRGENPGPDASRRFVVSATASLVLSMTLLALLGGFWLGRVTGLASGGAAYGFRATAFAAVATACCVAHGWASGGARFIGRFLAIAVAVSLSTELVGVSTGAIFGPYAYSAGFPAKLFGLVPVIIPFIWFSISYWSFATAQTIAGSVVTARPAGRIAHAVLAAALLLGYDLAADPNHVFRGGWAYTGPNFFYGVPLQNFVAWFVIGVVMFWALGRVAYPRGTVVIRSAFHDAVAPVVYLALLLHESAFAFLVSRLPGAGGVGLAVVATCGLALVHAARRSRGEGRDEMLVVEGRQHRGPGAEGRPAPL